MATLNAIEDELHGLLVGGGHRALRLGGQRLDEAGRREAAATAQSAFQTWCRPGG